MQPKEGHVSMSTKIIAKSLKQAGPQTREELLASVRMYAQSKGTVDGWDIVVDWSDEKIDSQIGKNTKSLLGAVQMIRDFRVGQLKELASARMVEMLEQQEEEMLAETESEESEVAPDQEEEMDEWLGADPDAPEEETPDVQQQMEEMLQEVEAEAPVAKKPKKAKKPKAAPASVEGEELVEAAE
jgi:hypothetical protein